GIEDVAHAQGCDYDRLPAGCVHFESYRAVANEVELIGRFVFSEQIVTVCKTEIARTTRNRGGEFGAETGEERVLQDDAFKPFHRHPSAVDPRLPGSPRPPR